MFVETFALTRYETWELDEMVVQMERPNPWLLRTFFPGEKLFGTKTIEFDLVDRGRRMAPFVSPLSQGKPMRREGFRTKQLAPAYIKPTDLVTPQEGFTRLPGESYGGTLSPQARFDRLVAEQLGIHHDSIDNRLEWMAAQALVTGGITISGDDYPTVHVDFGRDPALNIALTGAAKWTTNTAAPLDDLEAAALAVRRTSKGAIVNMLVMDGQTWNVFKKFASVQDLLDTRYRRSLGAESKLEMGPRTTLNEAIYVGTINGIFDIWVYDSYYLDDTGTEQPYLPPYTVLGIAQGALDGKQYFGAIIDLDANIEPRRVFSKSKVKFNPSGLELVTQSAPLVAPKRPNAMFALTVN
jgi:hypothetical protein